MKCPACQAQLETETYEGIEIETCPSCGGEWLDNKELAHIVAAREARFSEEERQALAAAPKVCGVALDDERRRLNCPKCGGSTSPINYGYESGVVIDKCTACRGIWLDSRELENVQMLFELWSEQVPETLAKFRDRLREIEAKWKDVGKVRVSRFALVNLLINGIFDIVR